MALTCKDCKNFGIVLGEPACMKHRVTLTVWDAENNYCDEGVEVMVCTYCEGTGKVWLEEENHYEPCDCGSYDPFEYNDSDDSHDPANHDFHIDWLDE